MPNLEQILSFAGIGLIVVGLYVFVLGKRKGEKGDETNKFEAFGIKIDVANPSILLIILGVVLLITPRVFPVDKAQKDLQHITEALDFQTEHQEPLPAPVASEGPMAPPAAVEVESLPAAVASPEPAASGVRVAAAEPTLPREAPAPAPVPEPPVADEASADLDRPADVVPQPVAADATATTAMAEVQPKPQVKPPVPAPARAPAPAATPTPTPARPAAEPTRPSPEVARVTPPAAPTPPEPLPPSLMILVQADVDFRAGFEPHAGKTFRPNVRNELTQAVREELGDRVRLADSRDLDFRDLMGRSRDRVDELCARAGSDRLLIGDVTASLFFGRNESDYWPNFQLYAVDCKGGRLQASNQRPLSPHVRDSYLFQQGIAGAARNFVARERVLLIN